MKDWSRHYNWQFVRRNEDYQHDFSTLCKYIREDVGSDEAELIEKDGVIMESHLGYISDKKTQAVSSDIQSFTTKWSITHPVKPSLKELPKQVRFSISPKIKSWVKSPDALKVDNRIITEAGFEFGAGKHNRGNESYVAIVAVDLRRYKFNGVKILASIEQCLKEASSKITPPQKFVQNRKRLDHLLDLIDLNLTEAADLKNPKKKESRKIALTALVSSTSSVRTMTLPSFNKQLLQDLKTIEYLLREAPLISFTIKT